MKIESNKNWTTCLRLNTGDGSPRVFLLNSHFLGSVPNRKYILCTNNENNICEEVTYKRLTNIQKELPHNLKYFKTDFVDKNEFPNVQLEDELLNYITPLVELEFGIDISNPSVQIILTEEQLGELIKEGKLEKDSTLFMHPTVLLNNKEAELLSKLNVTKQIIPDYYFGKELWS